MQLMLLLQRAPKTILGLDLVIAKIEEPSRFILAIFVYLILLPTTTNMILQSHQAISWVMRRNYPGCGNPHSALAKQNQSFGQAYISLLMILLTTLNLIFLLMESIALS